MSNPSAIATSSNKRINSPIGSMFSSTVRTIRLFVPSSGNTLVGF